MARFDLVALDADDTLWQNERLYDRSQADLASLLAPYGISPQTLAERLAQTEARNISYFGYGIKSFTLSMIEAAVDLTGDNLEANRILAILDLARAQLKAPIELLDRVKDTLSRLSVRYPLMIITKGEVLDQESKLERSGLAKFFRSIAVVSDKTTKSYSTLLRDHGVSPNRFLMAGNSLRSDILPVLELGGYAVHIPFPGDWQHEAADPPASGTPGFYQIEHIGLLPALLETLERTR